MGSSSSSDALMLSAENVSFSWSALRAAPKTRASRGSPWRSAVGVGGGIPRCAGVPMTVARRWLPGPPGPSPLPLPGARLAGATEPARWRMDEMAAVLDTRRKARQKASMRSAATRTASHSDSRQATTPVTPLARSMYDMIIVGCTCA